jgi:hypothetical protein
LTDDGIHFPINYCSEFPVEKRYTLRQKMPIVLVPSDKKVKDTLTVEFSQISDADDTGFAVQ